MSCHYFERTLRISQLLFHTILARLTLFFIFKREEKKTESLQNFSSKLFFQFDTME